MSFRFPTGAVLMWSDKDLTDGSTTSANEVVHLILVFALFLAALVVLVLAIL